MIFDKPELDTSFTSTGEKMFHHQEMLEKLRNGSGMPVSAWIAPTDVCNAKCSFCSVGEREGDVLPFGIIKGFVDQLHALGLKSVTLSGGGNPLLYRCKLTGKTIKDVIDYIYGLGIQVAMITNGMPLALFRDDTGQDLSGLTAVGQFLMNATGACRRSWKNLPPETLDKLTWCRISMAGLDANHKEQEVYVPDFDPTKTALGFSWIMSDSYEEPSHKHGWVSTPEDTRTEMENRKVVYALDRLPWIEEQVRKYVEAHNPRYVRLLCNCLQPEQIPERHKILQGMAERINPKIVFSQNKPPRQPKKCFKVLTRPCLNADSFVYPCDSTVLNRTAGHKFGSVWRICRWDQVGELYADPSKFEMPDGICPGCVFADQVDIINDVVSGVEFPIPQGNPPEHVNYI
jgi:MoaA/NifB/PqqE/SkfB family radical SAM enzyme